ncbi:MAG: ABC transporter ATP-binding protein [Chitinophagales bacterium]|nr:ABC transporter ATP-binding protein [Chitinophagales bacterium]
MISSPVIKYLRPYRSQVLLNIVFSIITVLFSLVSLIMIVPFLQLIFDKMPLVTQAPVFALSTTYLNEYFYYALSQQIIEHGKSAALVLFCFEVAFVFFAKNFFRYAAAYFLAPVKNGVVRDIRQTMFDKLMGMPLGFSHQHSKGEIITKMTSDLKEIETGLMSTLEAIIVSPITIFAYLSYMLFTSPMLTGFVLLMVIITAFFIGKIGKTLKRESSEGQQTISKLTAIIDESITGFKVILGFNAQEYQKEKFRKDNQSYFNTFNRVNRRRDLSSPLTEFLAIIIVCFVMWFGASLVLGLFDFESNLLNAERFIAYMIVFSQLISPAKSFSNAFYDIQKGLASYERVSQFLQIPNPIQEHANAKEIIGFKESIVFKHVEFGYTKERKVLKNISLEIKRGKVVALVGSSGAGKSTLVDLLPRFYDIDRGEILIDGINIKEIKIDNLRKLMGIVSQEAILFNDTVKSNIGFGSEAVQTEQIKEAAKTAFADGYISKLPNQYEEVVGERGGKLSGGERQRMTIARAVYKNPPILILDEATAALDAENEKWVQEAIQKIMVDRTCIIIAHRLTTIQHADEIILMHEGEIIDRGNHEELMKSSERYKRMVELQQF